MPIYTRTGDDGTTCLYNGKRVLKSNPQVEAYGSVDELSSFVGLVTIKSVDKKDSLLLTSIQKNLYQIMSFLSGAKACLGRIQKQIRLFEKTIDGLERQLPRLGRFIIPQGTEISCWFHILRTVCRRTERRIVDFFKNQPNNRNLMIVKYFNRLSDLFFILARKYNQKPEIFV